MLGVPGVTWRDGTGRKCGCGVQLGHLGAAHGCQNLALKTAGSHWSLGGTNMSAAGCLGRRPGQEDLSVKAGEEVG